MISYNKLSLYLETLREVVGTNYDKLGESNNIDIDVLDVKVNCDSWVVMIFWA